MAKYTEQHLMDVMKELMLKKHLDRITVQNLTDAANVNRKTFYFHYHGIADLLVAMYSDVFSRSVAGKTFTPDNWQSQYRDLLKSIRMEAPYLERIYRSEYAPYFHMKMEELIKIEMQGFIDAAIKNYESGHHTELLLTAHQLNYINQYYSTGFFGMLEQWFLSGMKEKEEDFIMNLRFLVKDNMYRTFENMDSYNRTSTS